MGVSAVALLIVVAMHGAVLVVSTMPAKACLISFGHATAVFEAGSRLYTLSTPRGGGMSCITLGAGELPVAGALVYNWSVHPFQVVSVRIVNGCVEGFRGFGASVYLARGGAGANASIEGVPAMAIFGSPTAIVSRCIPRAVPRLVIAVGVPTTTVRFVTRTVTRTLTSTTTVTQRAVRVVTSTSTVPVTVTRTVTRSITVTSTAVLSTTVTELRVATETLSRVVTATTTVTSWATATKYALWIKTVTESYVVPHVRRSSAWIYVLLSNTVYAAPLALALALLLLSLRRSPHPSSR